MKLTRGYAKVMNKVDKSPRYTKSCLNCEYYYKASGDREEVCQNDAVLEYDMVVEENRIYCLQWESVKLKRGK